MAIPESQYEERFLLAQVESLSRAGREEWEIETALGRISAKAVAATKSRTALGLESVRQLLRPSRRLSGVQPAGGLLRR